ncbi:MAG: septation protein [Nevskia sp.]|nr:septation protein [Nevskia sp.]
MDLLIDFIPALAFYAAYKLYDFYVATGVLIVVSLVMLLISWLRTRKLRKNQVFVAACAVVFGGLTLWLHDPEFLKLKLSLIYGVFCLALIGSQFVGKRVLMERIGESTIKLPPHIWRRLNLLWALFFAFCAGLNLFIARNYSDAVWVNFKLYGFSIMIFVFLLLHAPFLGRYVEPKTE